MVVISQSKVLLALRASPKVHASGKGGFSMTELADVLGVPVISAELHDVMGKLIRAGFVVSACADSPRARWSRLYYCSPTDAMLVERSRSGNN